MPWSDDEVRDDELPDESDQNNEDDADSDEVRCPHCGGWVYEDTPRCPTCGDWIVPRADAPVWRRWVWVAAVLLVAAALVVLTVW